MVSPLHEEAGSTVPCGTVSTHYSTDDEDPYFYHNLWWTKPGSRDGKRTKRKPLGSKVAPGAVPAAIRKTVEDPDNVLTKRNKHRLLSNCADTFVPGVYYSMEKRNRWTEANRTELLQSVNTDDASVQVVEEKAPYPRNNYCKYRSVVAVHELDASGQMVSRVAGGQGTSLSCLMTTPREKRRRNRRARRGAAEDEKSDHINEIAPRNPQVRYTIMHEKPHYYGRYVRGKPARFPGYQPASCDYLLDLKERHEEESSDDYMAHTEEDTYAVARRDQRFSLGDFITKKASKREPRSELSSAFEKIDLSERGVVKPFTLVDLTSVPEGTFVFATVNTATWTNFNFIEQVEALRQKKYVVRWLDRNSRRVLVDATKVADKHATYTGASTVVVVIERSWGEIRSHLRVYLNTTIPAEEDFNWRAFQKHLTKYSVSNLESLMDSIGQLIVKWKARAEEQVDDLKLLKQKKEHLPMFNVKEFISPTHRITNEHMANMLRDKSMQVDDGPFENLSSNGMESELEGTTGIQSNYWFLDKLPSIKSDVKCVSCGYDRIHKLCEMGDSWMCKQCVAQSAISQIRVDCVPISLPFAVHPNTSTYDVLPSILPLPLFNYYTKYAALKLIKQALGDVELSECPGCKNVVELLRTNAYKNSLCECGLVWCTDCKTEPHWPMNCEIAAEWRRRWKYRRSSGHRPSQRKKEVTCFCSDRSIVFEESAQHAECEVCKYAFNPQNMVQVPYRGPLKFPNASDSLLPDFHVPRTKKEVVEICEKARDLRFAVLSRPHRTFKNSVFNRESRQDIKIMALYMIEYGTAWVHMRKSLVDCVVLKRSLNQLIRQHEELLRAVEYQRSNSAESLESLKVSLRQTVDLIKRSL